MSSHEVKFEDLDGYEVENILASSSGFSGGSPAKRLVAFCTLARVAPKVNYRVYVWPRLNSTTADLVYDGVSLFRAIEEYNKI